MKKLYEARCEVVVYFYAEPGDATYDSVDHVAAEVSNAAPPIPLVREVTSKKWPIAVPSGAYVYGADKDTTLREALEKLP